ncbi:hypothetical protein VTN49DRAFT_2048 [Thermomyces lanuginosus]|uniref:uncharacterized protein n=1 Tax=Thermomyces lanuginosus TaxID=5541 RepID=UPI0037422655
MSPTVRKMLRRLQRFWSNLLAVLVRWMRHTGHPAAFGASSAKQTQRALKDLENEIARLFESPLNDAQMLDMSARIQEQLRNGLQTSSVCMLPSFTSCLPSGNERGTFLALDVGGSNFRVALIELLGREGGMKIVKAKSYTIDEEIKALEGTSFFDWMAAKIDDTLASMGEKYGRGEIELAMGLSWSFPVEQTSVRSGRVIHMGKGFRASEGTVGQDLSELILASCRKRGLNVRLEAIVNDGSATLLTRAYVNPYTRMSLILGTGTNIAVHFPVSEIGSQKFGERPSSWFEQATHVIVNSELSMFGGGVLPRTRWDETLNATHMRPDYQPLEYMITGRYLGEIVRLIIVEAVKTAGLFGGELPPSMKEAYSLDTSILATLEDDKTENLSRSAELLQKEHQFSTPPSVDDLRFLQAVTRVVSKRAAGYLATAIHSMWCLQNQAESASKSVNLSKPGLSGTPDVTVSEVSSSATSSPDLTIACDGSVINKYPGFRENCQRYLNTLTAQTNAASGEEGGGSITLELADESAIFGAAVAVATAVAERNSSEVTLVE